MPDSVLPSAPRYPASGEVLDGKYRVDKLLGEGGMGAVARATHLLLHRIVAVKFMNPQFMTFPGAVERFINEGRASGAIKSEHVVPVSDVGCLPTGAPYLVMECLYGLDLADLVRRDGPSGLPIERAVHFVVQILRGLQSAHAIGIIHRDMKPSNCFVVSHEGDEDFIKLLDFGISKIVQPGSASLTQTNSALGTPLYMSPEQARSPRDVDARSDLYSVGVILYELLTGQTPFLSESGEFTEILFQLFTKDAPPVQNVRPDLPDGLAAVVHKALAREVPDRYASALDFAEALEPYASDPTRVLIEKMRVFTPPSMKSFAPAEGLPTSMAAFSQLQQKHTDVMQNRPRAGTGTEVLVPRQGAAPNLDATELLQREPSGSLLPEPPATRARPEDALGKTQLDVAGHDSARPAAMAQTDLGASRDAAPAPSGRRSPLVFLLPLLVVGLGVGGVILAARGPSGGSPSTVDRAGIGAAATATAPATAIAPADVPPSSAPAPPSAHVTLAPTAAPSAASATPPPSASAPPSSSPAPKAAPKQVRPPPPNTVLGTGLHD